MRRSAAPLELRVACKWLSECTSMRLRPRARSWGPEPLRTRCQFSKRRTNTWRERLGSARELFEAVGGCFGTAGARHGGAQGLGLRPVLEAIADGLGNDACR